MKRYFCIIGICLTMLSIGYFTGWMQYEYPHLKARNIAREQRAEQERIEKQMTHQGEVINVSTNGLVVKEKNKSVSYTINDYTSLQIGNIFVSSPGRKPDLAFYMQKGDQIDLLINGCQALVIHRDLRVSEKEPTIPN